MELHRRSKMGTAHAAALRRIRRVHDAKAHRRPAGAGGRGTRGERRSRSVGSTSPRHRRRPADDPPPSGLPSASETYKSALRAPAGQARTAPWRTRGPPERDLQPSIEQRVPVARVDLVCPSSPSSRTTIAAIPCLSRTPVASTRQRLRPECRVYCREVLKLSKRRPVSLRPCSWPFRYRRPPSLITANSPTSSRSVHCMLSWTTCSHIQFPSTRFGFTVSPTAHRGFSVVPPTFSSESPTRARRRTPTWRWLAS